MLDASLADWQRLLDLLREWKLPMTFGVGGNSEPIPDDVASMFAGPDDEIRTLRIYLHGMQLNSHFFVEDEIELDLDPREVNDEATFTRLVDFMGALARSIGKPVILTPENWPKSPILEVRPSGPPVYHPSRG